MLARLTQFSVGLLLAASLALAAGCGGSSGGGGGDAGGGSGAEPVPEPGSNTVEGPSDPLQTALSDAGNTAGEAPVIGDTAQALLDSVVSLLEAPDGLATGFQDFLTNQGQNPEDLFNGGELAGDAILSFATGLSDTLIELNQEGQQIPGADQILQTLEELQTEVREGTAGQDDGGDLTAVTDLLNQLAGQLETAGGNVPSEVEDAPLVGDLLTALGTGAGDVATILDSAGRLNGDETSQALVGSFENLVNTLSGSFPGGAGDMLSEPLEQATTQFENGLGLLLNPLFQALRGVLAPVTGDDAPLAPVLNSLLAFDPTGGGVPGGFDDLGGLSDILAGGGMAGDGTEIPLLSDLLAGLPLLGDLVAGQIGGDASGGTETLTAVLENGGNGNVPLLGDLLQGIPNLSGAGTSEPPSLPILGDLLTTLLAQDSEGVPVISSILAEGQASDGSLDLPVIGGLLDSLLGNLLGQAGGVDSTGGFLDGLGGIPVLGSILDSLLGGLLSN